VKTDESKKFGEQLKQARIEQDLIQKDLAEMLSLNNWNVSDMEAGKFLPTKKQFEQICDLLNKTPEFFFPDGVPELREERKTFNKHEWKRPEARKMEIPEDEKNIKLDVEEEVESKKEEPTTVNKPAEQTFVYRPVEQVVPDKTLYMILQEMILDIPQLKDVIQMIVTTGNKYLNGTGEPTLDITIAYADKSEDDFMHRKIVNRTR
jgi:transcriptional regulator with XRE-family HTH domain